MDAHWSHLKIIPRDWSAKNSLSNLTSNFSPSIDPLSNQSTVKGASVNLKILASDVDGDPFTYSATGLPAGLSINSSNGQISGTASTSGNHQVKIIVSDGQFSDSRQFSWSITDSTSSGGGGTLPLEWIFLMLIFIHFRTRLNRYKR